MIRVLLFIAFLIVVYYVMKTVLRAAVRGYHDDEEQRRARLKGEEMVLDPECRTYVVKGRAITRRIDGQLHSFCSEACAKQYEDKKRH
ncbi:MAG TPA: hypothetical protein VFK23_12335 [Nitrospirota bacterium]|jgi:YHS domain-containing protein|nr:hypothetical protein [Nitrospirota bacterium]